ncbi:hypothetical protein [Ancylobacter amanitiformis]|uniref:Uncharacterized protein n=1 Tax=Ancylobacter amanitiformis TaxID=217069 RepID=A0ABU0LXR7_9HYPH|nr:hypothetical protein [Ancylobacter amanitiformis]MDQ0513522.1 hypothetical protein [Ancylobacter amanitiformis]
MLSQVKKIFLTFAVMASLSVGAKAEEFTSITRPSFAGIEPRLVYGLVEYDFAFAGSNGAARTQSASAFLRSLIQSRFSNRSGNYIVTLDLLIGDRVVSTEPIMSANWESTRFLFLTTSEKTNIVVNRNGALLEDIVVDGETNKVSLAMKIKYSSTTSVDMSLLTELSRLSKTASLATFAPGIKTISDAYAPFADIFARMLSRYTETSIVDTTTGAFTLLDEGYPNQLRYDGSHFKVNIYLKTVNSQLRTNFSAQGFNITNYSLPLTEVKSGIGGARAPVMDLIMAETGKPGAFLKAITEERLLESPKPAAETEIRDDCSALKDRLKKYATSRDATLLYWAFLRNYRTEILKYKDGASCGRGDLVEDLTALNLALKADQWPAQ